MLIIQSRNRCNEHEVNSLINEMSEGYSEYLNMPQEYKDSIIKKMYQNTKYAGLSAQKLREIFRYQRSQMEKK